MFSAGDLDVRFAGDGTSVIDLPGSTNEIANATVVQDDGKVVLVGRATVGAETDFFVARLLAGGGIDPTFGGGDGAITIDFAVNDEAMDVALDADGKMVVVGTSSSGAGSNARDFAIARLNANGTLDTSFSGDGKTTVDFGVNDDAQSVALDENGLIYVGGYKDLGTTGHFALARLLSSGAQDTSYSTDGEVFFGFGGNNDSRCYDIAIDEFDHVMMVGYDEVIGAANGRNFAYARVGPNALLDPVFSGDGLAVTDFAGDDDEARAVAIGVDGRITVGGFSPGAGGNDFTATRLSRGGALDSTFNGDGAFRLNLGGVEAVDDLVVHPDGDITLSGQTSVGSFQAALVRISAVNGQLSTTFGDGGDGIQFLNFGAIDDGFAVALDPRDLNTVVAGTDGSGKLAVGRVRDLIDPNFSPVVSAPRVVVGYPDHRLVVGDDRVLKRLLSDGSPDTSFSGDGELTLPSGEFFHGVAIDSQSRIVVLTTLHSASTTDAIVRRLLANGNPDTSFSGDGTMNFHFSAEPLDSYDSLAIDSQNRILVAGGQEQPAGTHSDFAVARITTAGVLDTSFDGDGIAAYNLSTALFGDDGADELLIQPDGKIILVGQANTPPFDYDVALVRLNTNGSQDNSFGVLGEVRQDIDNRDDLVFDAALDSAGRVVVAGHAVDLINPQNPGGAYLARFDSSGGLDNSFSGDGLLIYSGSIDQAFLSVSVQSDGSFLIGGNLELPEVGQQGIVRRLLPDLEQDTTFAGDGIWVSPVQGSGAFASIIDGAVYVRTFDTIARLSAPPVVTDFTFLFETSPQRVRVTFNDDVGDSLTNFDLTITNTTANVVLNPATHPLASYDHATNTATFNFNGILADGRYTATFSNTGIENRQSMELSGDRVQEFFFLAGDFNHDGAVNLADFNILASNFGQSNRTFAQGDANYDGVVNLSDFNILAAKFGSSLAPQASAYVVQAEDETASIDLVDLLGAVGAPDDFGAMLRELQQRRSTRLMRPIRLL